MSDKLGMYIEKYVAVRDRKKEMEARHKEELAPLNEALNALEDYFQKQMEKLGLEQLKSDGGTAYRSTQTSVTTSDKNAFLDYVRQHDAWHLVDARPAKTAINELVEETGLTPPGVDVKNFVKVNVRRA